MHERTTAKAMQSHRVDELLTSSFATQLSLSLSHEVYFSLSQIIKLSFSLTQTHTQREILPNSHLSLTLTYRYLAL